MALVNRSFSVNVTPGMMPPIVHVSEYDVGRAYTVSILNEQGNTFIIPSGTTASIEGTLNGLVGFTQSATVSNNQVSFTLSQSMTAYSGKAWCKIKLTLNNQPIQTCAFVLAVDRAGVEADTVIGAPGFEEQIQNAVDAWLDEHGGITVDDTLSQQGEAADAKAVGDKFADVIGEGVTPTPTVIDLSKDFVYVNGKAITESGEETVNNGSKIVDYFAVTPGKTYTFVFTSGVSTASNTRVHGYDSSRQWQSQVLLISANAQQDYTRTITVPSGVSYLRISINSNHTIKEFSYESSGGGAVGEYDNLSGLTSRVIALEESQVEIETDATLTIEGAAADAKAAGDAIAELRSQISGVDESDYITPTGNIDGMIASSGVVQSSNLTKVFYFPCQPNTKYTFEYEGNLGTSAHFIAEFSAEPVVGATSGNYLYQSQQKLELTTTANARFLAFGHGGRQDTSGMSVYSGNYAPLLAAESIDDWEIGGYGVANGAPFDNSQRLRTKNFIRITSGASLSVVGNEYSYCVYREQNLNTFDKEKTPQVFSSGKTVFNFDGYICVTVKSSADITAEIKQSLVDSVTIKLYRNRIKEIIEQEQIAEFNAVKAKRNILVGQPYAYLSAAIEDEILDSKTCADVYAIYDGLCTDHSETFVRLPDIGTETSQNLPIRMYRMKWTTPFLTATEASWNQADNAYDSKFDSYRRLFISAGTHGDEKSSAYGVALAIKEIVESDSEFAKYIRANFAIDIVPIVNPAGFNATTRKNGSNVDINRDFLTRNTAEAQAIYTVLTSNNYYACIDSHNSGGNANYIGIPNTSTRIAEYVQVGMKFGQIMFNDWKALSTGEQYATSPYMQFWLHSEKGMMQDLFTELGLVGWLIESVGVFASSNGTLTPNHKKYCKFTKDLLINSIICLGTNEWN